MSKSNGENMPERIQQIGSVNEPDESQDQMQLFFLSHVTLVIGGVFLSLVFTHADIAPHPIGMLLVRRDQLTNDGEAEVHARNFQVVRRKLWHQKANCGPPSRILK